MYGSLILQNSTTPFDGDITVILNCYRRPYNLKMQIEAIREQFTIPKHNRYSGFELYAEEDDKDVSDQDSLSSDVVDDDIRSSMGAEQLYSYNEVSDK